MSSATEDPFYRVAEAAEYLGVHPNTLRWWRRNNRGPLFQLRGSHHVYRKSALDDYAANGDTQPRKSRKAS